MGLGLVAWALMLSAGVAPAAASGTVTFDGSSGTAAPPPTLGSYQMTPFGVDPQSTFQGVTGVNDPAGDISFDGTLKHLTVGSGWATWSHGYSGDVYATSTSQTPDSVTITLPAGTYAFYLYAEPNPFAVIAVTATTDDGTTSGPVAVNGYAGAQYFGFYTDGSATIQTITVSSSTDFAIGEFGINTSGSRGCTTPELPQNVSNLDGSGSPQGADVTVYWSASASSCDPTDHYDIVNILSDGSIGGVAATVPDDGSPTYVHDINALNACTFYRFGVIAVDAQGRRSSVALPAKPAFTWAFPNASPPTVTIIIQGLGSSISGGNWNPLNTPACTSQTGDNSQIPPPESDHSTTQSDLGYAWLNLNDVGSHDYAGPGAGNNLIDSAASTGGLVLPLSYVEGTRMKGTASSPFVEVPTYNASAVANTNVNVVANYLNRFISSINRVFPHAKIVVVGHSNGGLVAMQWWANHTSFSPGPQHNVAQVFTLDSPINGIYAGTICLHPGISESVLCNIVNLSGKVSNQLLAYYGSLWNGQATNDPYWARQDAANQMWTPFVTENDPLYDVMDFGATPPGASVPNIGFASQGLVNNPTCTQVHWQSGCHLTAPDAISGYPYYDGSSQFFGAPGDLWVHSVVKNDPKVIAALMRYLR